MWHHCNDTSRHRMTSLRHTAWTKWGQFPFRFISSEQIISLVFQMHIGLRLLFTLVAVSAYSAGPPVQLAGICQTMMPNHGDPPQTGSSYFEIVVNNDCYKGNMKVKGKCFILYQWLSTRLTLQCVNDGDTAVLHCTKPSISLYEDHVTSRNCDMMTSRQNAVLIAVPWWG